MISVGFKINQYTMENEMRINDIPTPAYVIDEKKLRENLEILKQVQEESGCHILLAQKAFSAFAEYPLIRQYLKGTTSSGLFEARLAYEEMGGEVHVYAPAFKEKDLLDLVHFCDHITFNSIAQVKKYAAMAIETSKQLNGNPYEDMGIMLLNEAPIVPKHLSLGLRVNPECSTQGEHAIYDPCAPGSRLGVTFDVFKKALEEDSTLLDNIEGLHFHTLCEQNSDDLVTTFEAFEKNFGTYLKKMKWLNMGGGHHITRKDYDREKLINLIKKIKSDYDVEVYLEPGEAIALNAGYLVTEVLDIVENGISTLILDASAACHMPDVLEMPYRPPLKDSGEAGEKEYTYRLSSYTCLAGDIIGDYSFDKEIRIGDRLIFEDMAIYSMVKNNTFNGIPLPDICATDENGECRLIKRFGYEDFKCRLS